MLNRRNFTTKLLSSSFIPALAIKDKGFLKGISEWITKNDPSESDEDFWNQIRLAYTASQQIVNLNNGGVSPSPKVVQDAVEHFNKLANDAPSYYMWRIMDQGREPLRENLAKFAGVDPEELAINRNATESLDTVILGMSLKKGDQVVLSKYDYPNMLHAWRQREIRDGIELKYVDIDLPLEDNDKVIEKYLDQFTSKTKVVHLTHVVNWNGQILPVRKIADEAKKRGIKVVVDGAHSFAILEFKIPELNCDYFGTSLHKWLSAPIGSGMLWIKKEEIKNIFPLIPNGEPFSENIRKFENLGTRSFMIEQGIGYALNFQNTIGNKRKEDRLRYLKDYWTKEAMSLPKIKMYTPLGKEYSCAIANVGFEEMEAGTIESTLFAKFKIHTSPTKWEKINGARVTPHVYTTTRDLDRLLDGLSYISKM
ncbi:aminotransferase class V-fold PLP-dependent enzyme [Lacihabitans sp. LS3-19]|uniref:aminotransferase class V-fold PLP-dependent enzyme n=1 Tax=Lacihabitans sp. LS3-19 TaxID=2487335 RepID=UPI0020CF6222|nr:aminotransferase class V-fold PLP-dependent enzyme [Lacihabitans sp. LS3-19]MCP9767865.1 aminotransferase class V-fold PLP-dependent enzyme [Lacihabitans sp. LS3-19]